MLLFLLCAPAARAATEFCPASAGVASPIGAPFGSAATRYVYELTALTPRSVEAWIVADTDKGWFHWHVGGVVLANVKRSIHFPYPASSLPPRPYTVAASTPLAIDFPAAVVVRHVWIVSALALGDPSLPWNGKNLTPCDVPAFDSAQEKAPDPDLSPSPAVLDAPVAEATAADPPFEVGSCLFKFAEGTVKRPAVPQYSITGADIYGYATVVATALDPNGKLIDAWIYAASGNQQFDRAVLRAARISEYVGGISYCRPVSSRYLFMGTLTPN